MTLVRRFTPLLALVAIGSGGSLSTNLKGDGLAVLGAATWAAYSVAISPLMRRYTPFRLSAVFLLAVFLLAAFFVALRAGDLRADFFAADFLAGADLAAAVTVFLACPISRPPPARVRACGWRRSGAARALR